MTPWVPDSAAIKIANEERTYRNDSSRWFDSGREGAEAAERG